jgi:hypothetical protein
VEQDPPTGDLPVKTRTGNLIRGGEPSEKIGHFSADGGLYSGGGFGGGAACRTCKVRRSSKGSAGLSSPKPHRGHHRGRPGDIRGGMQIVVKTLTDKTITMDVGASST